MTNRSIILGAALAAALSTGAASAGERSVRVSHADLDLASAEGQAELQRRVDSATRRACRFTGASMMATAQEENACYRVARRAVDVQVAQLIPETQRGG